MLDSFGRDIGYLRISVTDRCNLRCRYCMPEQGIALKSHADILTFEQIEAVVRAAVSLGITKVRLTGGEPLLRRNITDLVARIAAIPGLTDLSMTTNGTRLAGLAQSLKDAGLRRINISLDSLDPQKYAWITRGGDLAEALAGVQAARAAGLAPIKINMVVMESTAADDACALSDFCAAQGLQLQKIAHFSLLAPKSAPLQDDVQRPPPCAVCNRLRLTADGWLKPCLCSEEEIRVDFTDLAGSLRRAVAAKPARGAVCRNRAMPAIGG